MKHTQSLILLTAVLVIGGLSGCKEDSKSVPDKRPNVTIKGGWHDAPIRGGTVSAYEWSGSKGKLLGTAKTDKKGNYSLPVNTNAAFVWLEIKGGTYTEEVSGKNVALKEGDTLYSITPFKQQSGPINASATYFTHIATGLTEYYLTQGYSADKAWAKSYQELKELLGYDILTTVPTDITADQKKSVEVSDSVDYGFNTAAISLLTADISKTNDKNLPVHSKDTSIAFAKLAYNDIKHDGKLDAQDKNGTVYMQRVRLTPDHYQKLLALAKLKIAALPINKTGFTPKDLLARTSAMNSRNASIFVGSKGGQISLNKPSVSEINLKTNQVISAKYELKFTLLTESEIQNAELYINDVKKDLVNSENTTYSYKFNTTTLPDGKHSLVIKATDILSNKIEYVVEFAIANNQANFSERYPQANSYVRDTVIFESTVTSTSAIKKAQFKIGALSFDAEVKSKGNNQYRVISPSINTKILNAGKDGLMTYKVVTQNVNFKDNESASLQFTIDNTKPAAKLGLANINADGIKDNYVRGQIEFKLEPKTFDANLKSWKLTMGGRLLCTSEARSATVKPIGYWDETNSTCAYGTGQLKDAKDYKAVLEVKDKAGNVVSSTQLLHVANEPMYFAPTWPSNGAIDEQTYTVEVKRGKVAATNSFLKVDNVVVKTGMKYIPDSTGHKYVEICVNNVFGEVSCRGKRLMLVSTNTKLAGVAHDAPIINGHITAYEWNGKKGKKLGETRTDKQGNYSLLVKSKAKFVRLEITDGHYNEEVSGEEVPLTKGKRFMYAITPYQDGQEIDTQITFLTNTAAGYIEYLVSQGQTPDAAVRHVYGQFKQAYGYDIATTKPADITVATGIKLKNVPTGTDYGFTAAALSLITADFVKLDSRLKLHKDITSLHFIESAYADIKHDGKLDGIVANGRIKLDDKIPVYSEHYQHLLALAKLKIADKPFNKTGYTGKDLFAATAKMYASQADFFGNPPSKSGKALTDTAPVIKDLSIKDKQIVIGNQTVKFKVDTGTEIKAVNLKIANADKPLNKDSNGFYSHSFDTKTLKDGSHSVAIEAKDILNNVTNHSVNLVVSNEAATVSNILPSNESHIRGSVRFSANIHSYTRINQAYFKVGNFNITALVTHVGNNNYKLLSNPVNTKSLNAGKDGRIAYTIDAYNINNKKAPSPQTYLTIDNTLPTPSIDKISADQKKGDFVRGIVRFTLTPKDDNVKSWKLVMGGRVLCSSQASDNPVGFLNGNECGYASTQFSDSRHYAVDLHVTDKAGNHKSTRRHVHVANQRMFISASFPANRTTGKQNFGLNVSSGKVGYSHGYLKMNGTQVSGWSFDPSTSGDYLAQVCAKSVFGEEECRSRRLQMIKSSFNIKSSKGKKVFSFSISRETMCNRDDTSKDRYDMEPHGSFSIDDTYRNINSFKVNGHSCSLSSLGGGNYSFNCPYQSLNKRLNHDMDIRIESDGVVRNFKYYSESNIGRSPYYKGSCRDWGWFGVEGKHYLR